MKTPISFFTRLLILLIFSAHIHLSSSFTQTDNQIFDLESLDETGFIAEANYWNASSLRDGVTKDFFCYNKFLLGGYNILSFNTPSVKQYFNRTYTGLPPHNMILFSFLFQPIDSWDGAPDDDHVDIWFDTTSFSSWMLLFGSSLSSYLCGNPIFPEYPGIITIIQVAHSAPTLTVKVVNQLNEDTMNESFGFRDIQIIFYNSTNLTNSFCGQASFTLPSMPCPCPSTKHYMSPAGSGTCYACDSSCGTCSGPLSTNCLTCDPGSYLSGSKCFNCSSSCLTCNGGSSSNCLTCPAGYFLFMNNTCISECPYPMVQSSNGIIQYCSTPCNPTPYLLWDQTCSGSCNPPLTTTTFLTIEFCVYPCSPTQYLYWNGTCATTCNSPLSKSTSHNRLYCNYPCTSGYLYWDGTCNPSCNSPLTPGTIALKPYCTKPCQDGQYLYWNGSCISSCNAPLSIASPSVIPVCNFPCSPTSLILYWDGSCGSTCNSPLVLKTEGTPIRNFCTFPCSIGEFLYWNGTCSSVCIPPLTYSYQNGRSFCHYPCTSGQYLHWNGTCQGACNPPLVPRFEATLNYCDFPCNNSDYLYWNGTCLPSCDAPLLAETQGSAKFCYFPCSSTSNFLYYNGTCTSQCLSPLQPKTEGTPSRNFCNGPCSNLSEYYTWYGTCTATCNPPLTKTTQYQVNFCKSSCAASQYLYWNGSCLANCDTPLSPRIVNSAKFCDFPCESQSFYLNWDGTCSLSCPGSSIVSLEGTGSNLRRFCRYGCSNNDYLYWNGSCLSTCPSPFRQSTSGTYGFCGSPCVTPSDFYYESTRTCSSECNSPYVINDTTSYPSCVKIVEEGWIVSHVLTSSAGPSDFSLITLVKMMHYIKYLDINMPPRLERLVLSKARNIFSLQFGYSLSNSSDFSEEKLATIFEKYGLPSDFLVNFWQELTIFGIFILLALGFTALENICKIYGWKTWGYIFERLRGITRWNMLIIAMLASVDDIILYSSFQFKTFSASFSSTFTVISLFVCILTNAVIVLLIGLMIFLAVKLQQAKASSNSNNEDQNCLDRFKDFQVLFEGFHHNTLFKQLFYLIYIVRLALPMVVASYFSIWPLYQMITQVSLSGVIIMYIICARPLQKQVNNVQLIITETLTLGMNACVLILTIRDYNGIEQSNLDVILGDLVIFGNFLTNTVLIVFLIIKLLIEGNKIYKGLKGSSSSKPKTAWIHLLAVPIQQGGLGFEEINPTLYEEPPVANFNRLENKGSFVPLSGQENKIMKDFGYFERKGDIQSYNREEYELESDFGSRRKGSSNPTRDVTPGFVANTTPDSSPSFPRFYLDEPVMKLEDFMTQAEEVEVRDDFGQEGYDTSSRGYYLDSYGRRKR